MDQWQPLLERFLRNECTERENKLVYHALRDGLIDDVFRSAIDSIMLDQDTFEYIDRMPPVSDDLLKSIRSRMKTMNRKRPAIRRVIPEWLKIAAAVVITLTVSWLGFRTMTQPEPTLTMNTITVPSGQTVHLKLAEGTSIWLNSRTVMKYPGEFKGSRREVILDGEGFFEVAHDQHKPFVVHTGKFDIQVLGTQFNVEAYSQSSDFVTALLNGSVKITSISDTAQALVLQPNTLARLHEGVLTAESITDYNHYRWREGMISFKDVSFTDLMTKFEKCYGIRIVVENKRAKDYICTGKFRQSDGIDYALRVLQRDVRFTYTRDEEKHIICIK